MVKAITPSTEKIQKHGVQSVRQRVVNLRELGLGSMDGLKTQIARQLCEEKVRQLTAQQIAEIEEIEKTYLDKDFITNP
jgi:lipoic acid synthetase/lipoate-protein ligase A